MVGLLFAFSAAKSDAPQELYEYLARKDSAFRYEIKDKAKGVLQMVSQTWQGQPWKHTILYREPAKLQTRGTAILYITGDGPRQGDYLDSLFITEATGMPTAMLFVPSLRGVGRSAPYLHDGRAATLQEIFLLHNPQRRHGRAHELTKEELNDLLVFVKCL